MVNECHLYGLIKMNGILFMKPIHGNHGTERILYRHTMQGAVKLPITEVPPPVKVILKSRSNNGGFGSVVINVDVFRCLKVAQVIGLLALHGKATTH